MSGSPMVQRAIGSFWNSTPVSRSSISIPHTVRDRKSTRLNSSHSQISYAVFCLKKKKKHMYTACHFYYDNLDHDDDPSPLSIQNLLHYLRAHGLYQLCRICDPHYPLHRSARCEE